MKFALIPIIITLALTMCNLSNSKPIQNEKRIQIPKQCIAYNDTAISFDRKAFFDHNTAYLDSALLYVDKAIACDSTYFIAYNNKFTFLNEKQDFNGALECINKIISLSKSDPGSLFMKGMFLESHNMHDSAYKIYSEVNLMTGEKLRESKKFSSTKVQLYLLTSAILNGSTVGAKRFDSVYDIFQDSTGGKQIMQIKDIVDSIETKSYIPKQSGTITIKIK